MNITKRTINFLLIIISFIILGVYLFLPREIDLRDISQKNTDEFVEEAPESCQQGEYTDILVRIDDSHKVSLFLSNDGFYYLFLPAFINEEDIEPLTKQAYSQLLKEDSSISSKSLKVMQSRNLSTIMIDLYKGDISHINSNKDISIKARMEVIDSIGSVECDEIIHIHGHGYSSFYETEDKSYKINSKHDIGLLGMVPSKDWVLTSNAFDASHIRTKTVYDVVDRFFEIVSVESEFADVYINGNYEGSYLVSEDIDAASAWERKNGGILLNINRAEEHDDVISVSDDSFILEYPSGLTAGEMDVVREKIRIIESTIEVCTTEDDLAELNKYVDVDSLVDMYIINFLTQEPDANINSTYYHIGDMGKLTAGPVWDYDRAFGSEIRGMSERIDAYINGYPENLYYMNSSFRDRVSRRLRELDEESETKSLKKEMFGIIGEYSGLVRDSLTMDRVVNGFSGLYSVDFGDIDQNTEYLMDQVESRFELLSDYVENESNYPEIRIEDGNTYRNMWISHAGSFSQDELNLLKKVYGAKKLMSQSGFEITDKMIFEKGQSYTILIVR